MFLTERQVAMNDPALDTATMRASARAVTALLRAMANEVRLLLCQMIQGEKSVGELEAALDIRQPTLSQQLAVLRAENLVTTRRNGKRIFHAVSDPNVRTVLNTLYALYCPPPLLEPGVTPS